MNIELFQLENLLITRTGFLFLDLRSEMATSLGSELEAMLRQAKKLSLAEVDATLASSQVTQSQPIVLLCEQGHVSTKEAQRLEALGYQNVYVVAGGLEGLCAEFSR